MATLLTNFDYAYESPFKTFSLKLYMCKKKKVKLSRKDFASLFRKKNLI